MRRISALLLGLLLTGVFTLPAGAGTLTTNKFLYKPSAGARGDIEQKKFDASLDRIDARLGKEVWVGDPNYGTTLQDAITAIGTTKKTVLRIPAGAWAINSYLVVPKNINLKFEEGAYLDLSGLPSTDIQGLASSGSVTVVTWANHGLSTGNYVTFNNIRQYNPGVSPTWASSASWMNLNNIAFAITKIDNNSFSVAVNSSYAWYSPAYDPVTDPGTVSACIRVQGTISAGLQKIFSYTGNGTRVWIDNSVGKNLDLYPEWWGAMGDNATDDIIPINQAIAAANASGKAVVRLSSLYYVSDTVSVNDNLGKVHIKGIGNSLTGFRSEANGYPAFEVLGTCFCEFSDFIIIGSTTATPTSLIPSVAIMEGRSKATSNSGNYSWSNIQIRGTFQYGEIYNQGNGLVKYNNIDSIVWAPPDASGLNNRKFGVCFTPTNLYGLAPRNSTLSTWTSIGISVIWVNNSQFSFSSPAGHGTHPAGIAAYLFNSASGIYFNNVYTGGLSLAGDNGSDIWQLIDSYGIDLRNCQLESNHRYTINISSSVPAQRRKNIRAVNISGSSTHSAFLITDVNTSLNNCYFADTQMSSSTILLNGGSEGSTFLAPYGMTSFVCTAVGGNFQNNYIELPFDTKVFDISACGANAYNNLIRDMRLFATQTLIDGNLQIGQPTAATPSIITVSPYKMTWAAAAPTTGSWKQGSVIWNTAAATGAPSGWICVMDNTFGTLNGSATTGSITTGTKSLTVNSVTGLTIGNFIDIAGVSGPKRITNIDSTNKIVTIDSNANATVAGAAVSFHNHTTAEAFKAMANLQ